MNLKSITFVVASALSLSSNAASVSWNGAQNSASFNDVSTNGTLVKAVNATSVVGTTTVNGVVFTNSDNILSLSAGTGLLNGATSGNASYDSLLGSLDYGNGMSTTIAFGGGNLTVGGNYQIQVWYADLRPGYGNRTMTFSDGLGSSVKLGSVGAGLGQFATGTFTANSSNQNLVLAITNGGNVHINAYQIRELPVVVASVPEPETYAMLLAGLGLMGAAAKRRIAKQA